MALVFTKLIPESNWILSDNNNILEFSDDDDQRTPLSADITIGTINPIRIFPLPDESFWFNCKDYFSTLLDDYDANLDVLAINASNLQDFILNWSKIYASPLVAIVVTFDNGNTEVFQFTPNIILGVEQIEEYFKQMTITEKEVAILSPLLDKTKNTHYLKIWEGYPFDVAYTKPISDEGSDITTVKNLSTGIETPAFQSPNAVNRIVFSNGLQNTTLSDWLPLKLGYNLLKFDEDNFIELHKVDTICGVYVRWINQYGSPNYWLFRNSEDNLATKSLGVITNDFFNVADSNSQSRSLGRTSQPTRTVYYDRLTEKDIDLLKGIVESPRVSVYTADRFAPNPNGKNWIDVSLSNKNLLTRNFKNKTPSGSININLPSRYTITL